MTSSEPLPEFVLFGDSLTEWSFREATQGFGLVLEKAYAGKATIVNEGQAGYTSSALERDFDRIIRRATSPNAAPTLLFTIFLGANDACIMGDSEYVPWAKFQENIHAFIRTILKQQAMASTKIVLITPPPIGIPAPILDHELLPAEIEDKNMGKRGYPPFKTYMSKKRYAEGIMKIAGEYEETGRVVGLDFWRAIISALLEEGKTQGTGKGEAENEFDEDMPPGCGLVGAKTFGLGWFTDGLHLNVKGYNVLSEALLKTITGKWPELAPDKL